MATRGRAADQETRTAHRASAAAAAACRPGAPTYLRSALQTWVSLDLPEPQGSIRYCESITTARTPPRSWASSCSTDTDTRAHIPLGRSVLQVLRGERPSGGGEERKT